MDSSFGKSVRRRREICSGLQAIAQLFAFLRIQNVRPTTGIGIVLLHPIHDRLARDIELPGNLGYAASRSSELKKLMPEFGRVGPRGFLGHGGVLRCKPESLHGTDPTSLYNW